MGAHLFIVGNDLNEFNSKDILFKIVGMYQIHQSLVFLKLGQSEDWKTLPPNKGKKSYSNKQ